MDLVDPGSLHSTQAGKKHRRGPKATVGETAIPAVTHSYEGAQSILRPPAGFGHTCGGAETPRSVSWQAQGQPLWASETLSGHKEGRLKALPGWDLPTPARQLRPPHALRKLNWKLRGGSGNSPIRASKRLPLIAKTRESRDARKVGPYGQRCETGRLFAPLGNFRHRRYKEE